MNKWNPSMIADDKDFPVVVLPLKDIAENIYKYLIEEVGEDEEVAIKQVNEIINNDKKIENIVDAFVTYFFKKYNPADSIWNAMLEKAIRFELTKCSDETGHIPKD